MSSVAGFRLLRHAARSANANGLLRQPTTRFPLRISRVASSQNTFVPRRCLSITRSTRAGMMPDSSDPQPPSRVEEDRTQHPTQLSDDDYHVRADEYMDAIHEKAEEVQETRTDVEVEYSAGVLSVNFPPAGTYVINKQPPNKQIWLSSPISGPKRYDWVVDGESMHDKQGSGEGQWVYLRDGSSLTELVRKELGLTLDVHGHEEGMKPTLDPTE